MEGDNKEGSRHQLNKHSIRKAELPLVFEKVNKINNYLVKLVKKREGKLSTIWSGNWHTYG